MSKRSQAFERIANDAYYTPEKAIIPLLRHVGRFSSFAEPCCGDGSIVKVLTDYGMHCTYQGDITTGQDAKTIMARDIGDCAMFVTNPPYERTEMHAIMEHLRKIRPSWFLIESDWMFTKQSAGLMRHCSDVVPIGRVKWFTGTKSTGYDNYAWIRLNVMTYMSVNFHPMEASR